MVTWRRGHRPEVLVGVDCSPASAAALRFAVREAGLRHAALVVLLSAAGPGRRGGGRLPAGAIETAERDLCRFCREVGTDGVDVEPVVTVLPPGPALVGRSDGVQLLVVGAPRGGWSRPTVPADCLHRARCPVAVVGTPGVRPGPRPDPGPGDGNVARYL